MINRYEIALEYLDAVVDERVYDRQDSEYLYIKNLLREESEKFITNHKEKWGQTD
jgi:hypothetical protein